MGYHIAVKTMNKLACVLLMALCLSANVSLNSNGFAAVDDSSISEVSAPQSTPAFNQTHNVLQGAVDMAFNSRQLLASFYQREMNAWQSPAVTDQPGKRQSLPLAEFPRSLTHPRTQHLISKILTGKDFRNDGLGLSQSMTLNMLSLQRPIRFSLLTSGFGWRHGRLHYGTDFASPVGTPIYAAESGQVVYSDYYHDYGQFIKISHGNGITTHYAHCQKMLVTTGQWVDKGQMIGTIGMTGRSTGAHLHFELAVDGIHINPENYMASESLIAQASLFMINKIDDKDDPFESSLYENPREIALEF